MQKVGHVLSNLDLSPDSSSLAESDSLKMDNIEGGLLKSVEDLRSRWKDFYESEIASLRSSVVFEEVYMFNEKDIALFKEFENISAEKCYDDEDDDQCSQTAEKKEKKGKMLDGFAFV
jgi:hypothetical protein